MSIKFSDLFNNIDDQRLEEVLNRTKDVAETMSKKSAERIELSRKKVELLDAKAKIAKHYEKFGRLNYDRYIGLDIDDAVIDDIASQIAEYNNKIELLNTEIEIAKESFNDSLQDIAQDIAKKTRDAFNQDKESVDADSVEVVEAESEED